MKMQTLFWPVLTAMLLGVFCVRGPAPAQPADPPTPATSPAPASAPGDLCHSAVDPYDSIEERLRFFRAAGVDNELDAQEFAADRARPHGFIRRFDRWSDLLRFDKDRNGTVDWFEADAYRQALRRAALQAFDADKDGKLAGKEREGANDALAGKGAVRLSLAGQGVAPLTGGQDDDDDPPQQRLYRDYKALVARFDADGDGRLAGAENEAMQETVDREQAAWEMDRYDADRDGKLSADERRTMRADASERANRQRQKIFQQTYGKYDLDGDGKPDNRLGTASFITSFFGSASGGTKKDVMKMAVPRRLSGVPSP